MQNIDVSGHKSRRIPSAEIVDRAIETVIDDPFPDYDTEPVMMYAND